MARVIGVANRHDHDPWLPTATNLREEMEGTSTLDPSRDVLIAEVDGEMVALASVERVLRGGTGTYDLRGTLLPGHRRRGIGRAMLRANLQRATEHALETGDAVPPDSAWLRVGA